MGLFTAKPYKMDSLNIAERAAVSTAMEVALQLDTQGKVTKKLKTALRDFNKGKMSKEDMAVAIACLLGSLKALSSGEDPDRSSLLNCLRRAIQHTYAIAIVLRKFTKKKVSFIFSKNFIRTDISDRSFHIVEHHHRPVFRIAEW